MLITHIKVINDISADIDVFAKIARDNTLLVEIRDFTL